MIHARRQEVEAVFGALLEWDRLNDKRASRIRWIQQAGYELAQDEWPTATAAQADAMIRLAKAIAQPLADVAANLG